MNCPFCNIDLEKNKTLKEGKLVRVIFSDPCLMLGHLLVIPKRHIEKLSELNEEERTELFETTIEFQERILNKLSSGCDIRQNYRPFQTQNKLKVNHLHIHLQPRELYDELYEKCQVFEKEVFKELSSLKIEKIFQLLRD